MQSYILVSVSTWLERHDNRPPPPPPLWSVGSYARVDLSSITLLWKILCIYLILCNFGEAKGCISIFLLRTVLVFLSLLFSDKIDFLENSLERLFTSRETVGKKFASFDFRDFRFSPKNNLRAGESRRWLCATAGVGGGGCVSLGWEISD